MWSDCASSFSAVGFSAAAWLLSTSTPISTSAAAAARIVSSLTRRPRNRGSAALSSTMTGMPRAMSDRPSEEPKSAAGATPAEDTCTPTTPATPTTPSTAPAAMTRRSAMGGDPKAATPSTAAPTTTMSPTKSSKRDTTASGLGGFAPTTAAERGSDVAATPTPKANDPDARWPSTDDTVFHVTV